MLIDLIKGSACRYAIKCLIRATFINLHPKEKSQKFHCYPFAVKLGRCVGSCNTANDLPNKVCVRNKAEESNKLTKHVSSCEYKCRFGGTKYNSGQWWNNDKC